MSSLDPRHALLLDLEPEAGRLLDRHLAVAKEWFPHEYVPYSMGRDFDREPWTPDQPRITGVAQIAFEVGLLTEDNLPSYHRAISDTVGRDSAWGTWLHRWTAEEGRHAIAMRDEINQFLRQAVEESTSVDKARDAMIALVLTLAGSIIGGAALLDVRAVPRRWIALLILGAALVLFALYTRSEPPLPWLHFTTAWLVGGLLYGLAWSGAGIALLRRPGAPAVEESLRTA